MNYKNTTQIQTKTETETKTKTKTKTKTNNELDDSKYIYIMGYESVHS